MRSTDKYKLKHDYYTKINSSKIYVDYTNNRVNIIEFNDISVETIDEIIQFSVKNHIGKIICNCDNESLENFLDVGFELEGKIDGYFKGRDAYCIAYFINSDRKICSNYIKKELLVKQCLALKYFNTVNNPIYAIRNATENDINEMVKLFSKVFPKYSTLINEERYLSKNINGKIIYKVAIYEGKIIGIASADIDKGNLNAKLTDYAVYPNYGGIDILLNLICSLELELKSKGMITLYSLARAINKSANIALSKQNYKYSGRLVNDGKVSGYFEDMNIWVKNISNVI